MELPQAGEADLRLPSIRGVNGLYLITIMLVVTLGIIFQAWNTAVGLLLTELGLVWLPAYLYLWRAGLPVDETVRWRWPGANIAALAALTGAGFAFFVIWLGELGTRLFGYTLWLPPDFYPQNWSGALILFTGLVIAAPLCEEFLFRGVIQRAYERQGAWIAIIAVSVLFTAFHLSLQRLFLLIPIALVLGYAAWRSASLISSILMHMSYNFIATAMLIAGSLKPDLNLEPLVSPPVAAVGLLVGLFGAWAIHRVQVNEYGVEEVDSLPASSERSLRLIDFWPLVAVTPVFAVMATAEVVVGLYPERLATGQLTLGPAPWNAPSQWTYELRNVMDETVGQAVCQLQPGEGGFDLACQVQQDAFEAEQDNIFFQADGFQAEVFADWDANSMWIEDMQAIRDGERGETVLAVAPKGEMLLMAVNDQQAGQQSLDIPADALVQLEWPWRLSALPFSQVFSTRASLAWPARWSENQQASVPTVEEVVLVVQGGEPLATPAGNFMAWRVAIGDQTAWYNVEAPHTLLQYDDGMVTYVLVKEE